MYTIVALAFCLLLGVMLKAQGLSALFWTPFGFVFGIFVTAQILLPLMLGLPKAVRLVAKRQMRAAVFGRILITPVIWFVLLAATGFGLGLLWPSTLRILDNNMALNLGAWLGTIAIVLTPFSKKGRSDYKDDFEKSYDRYYTRSHLNKEVEAAITVASNLYLHTLNRMEAPSGALQLDLPDSRYRYLLLCFSATMTACASELTNRNAVKQDGMKFLTQWATEHDFEFFGGPVDFDVAIASGITYLREFDSQWTYYIELEKRGAYNVDVVSSMSHSIETNAPVGGSDTQRLGELALEVACRMPAMQAAFVELVNR